MPNPYKASDVKRGNYSRTKKRDNDFSFKRLTSLLPVGSRSNLISVRVQEQVLHQTLIEVRSRLSDKGVRSTPLTGYCPLW